MKQLYHPKTTAGNVIRSVKHCKHSSKSTDFCVCFWIKYVSVSSIISSCPDLLNYFITVMMTNDGCHTYCPVALVIILEAIIQVQFLARMSDIHGDSASGPAALAGVISRRRRTSLNGASTEHLGDVLGTQGHIPNIGLVVTHIFRGVETTNQ